MSENINMIDKIRQSSFLDLLFDKKNKEYGAYELRSKYTKRLVFSLVVVMLTIVVTGVSMVLSDIISKRLKNKKVEIVVHDVELSDVKKDQAPPPPPPPAQLPEPKVEMKKFTPPKIVKDDEVPDDEKPPDVAELLDTKIGTVDREGIKSSDVIEAPVSTPEAGPIAVAEEAPLEKVEIEAGFPGGPKAWSRYVEREISKYIDELSESGFSGTVVVQFIVDKMGKVSDVKALTNGHTKFAQIAIKAIQNGPAWIPAVQNGKQVKAYRRQPVTFKVEEN